ncbi:unnamed protein product [Adineta ricciae]|uniref:Uncharacterized protein n=1 Tax=Adineta ricciae TaxID=249248 RepID=A0A814YRK8_ADIRI|nr:unnamed protein product [Adineta ricciae]CAF1478649.1 unnamed protein product [Adineta ricciae]
MNHLVLEDTDCPSVRFYFLKFIPMLQRKSCECPTKHEKFGCVSKRMKAESSELSKLLIRQYDVVYTRINWLRSRCRTFGSKKMMTLQSKKVNDNEKNCHRKRPGWLQYHDSGLSISSPNTTWIRMVSKSINNTNFSVKNGGYTENTFPFVNQDGEYILLYSTGYFRIKLVEREMIVRDEIETTLSMYDHFSDNISHSFDWQSSTITNEVNNIMMEIENNLPTFLINGKNQS